MIRYKALLVAVALAGALMRAALVDHPTAVRGTLAPASSAGRMPGDLVPGAPVANRPTETPGLRILRSDTTGVTLELVIDPATLEIKGATGGDCSVLSLPDHTVEGRPGWPALPARIVMLGVPPAAELAVAVLESESVLLPGAHDVCPASTPRVEPALPEPHLAPDTVLQRSATAYVLQSFWPQQAAEAASTGYLRDMRVAQVTLRPVQVVPATGQLRVATRLLVRVQFAPGGAAPAAASAETGVADPAFEPLLAQALLNYDTARAWRRAPQATQSLQTVQQTLAGPSVRIEVDQDGIHAVTPAGLEAAGVATATIDPGTFRLRSQGQEIAIDVIGAGDGVFSGEDVLLFYGEPIDTRFTGTNVYWLTWGEAPGVSMDTRNGTPSGAATTPTSHTTTAHWEQNIYYLMSTPSGAAGDHWVGPYIYTTLDPVFYTATLTRTDGSPGTPEQNEQELDLSGLGGVDYVVADVSNPPPLEELVAELGTRASVGSGTMALVNDNGLSQHVHQVFADGVSQFCFLPMVVAESTILTSAIATDGYAGGDKLNGTTFREAALVSQAVGGTTYQVYVYWDDDGHLSFAKRHISSTTWTLYHTAIGVANSDSHRSISIGIDPDGYLHVAYGMHYDGLLYRRSAAPIAAFDGTLTAELSMLGTNETSVTYPTFFNDPTGKLYFIFRDGSAGDGDGYFYEYGESTTTWSAATGTGTNGRLWDGTTSGNNAYWWTPVFDDDFGAGGHLHLMWCWREPGGVFNHDLAYARWDGTSFETISGAAQTVPITSNNDDHALTIAVGTLLNQGHMDVDGNGRPHLAYLNTGADGYWHYYHLWYSGSTWETIQLSTSEIDPFDPFGLFGSVTGNRADVAVDRVNNKVYIICNDPWDADGLTVYTSAPNDFATWTKTRIYRTALGYYEPTHDYQQWRDNGILYIPMAEWFEGGSAWDITMLRWQP